MAPRTVLAVALVLALPASALAQQHAAAPAPAAAPTHGATPAQEAMGNGLRLLVAHDFDGATAAFQQASQSDPGNPAILYYLGETARMKGNLTEAVEDFRQSARLAANGADARWQARGLQGVAESLERIDGRRDDARSAWNDYLHFAEGHTDVANADYARARIQAITAVAELDAAYADVRERIAARERHNAEHPPAHPAESPH